MRRPFFVRVAVRALLGVPASLAVLLVILLVLGGRPPVGVVGQLVPVSVLCVVLGLLVRWSRRFLIPTAVVGLLIALISAMLSAEYGFAHPESFFDFTTSLVIVVGPLLASIASVVAIVLRRRGTLDREPRSGEVRALQTVGACVVVLALISAFLTVTQRATVVAAGDVTEVTLHDDRYTPSAFRLSAGDRVEFLLRNEDSYAHTFSIDALEVDEYAGPRSERVVAFVAGTGGQYELYCAIIGHEEMVGTILVEPR